MTRQSQSAEGEHLETKVKALLTRFDALHFEELKDLVFADGSFSYSRECELEVLLARLKQRGTIRAPGRWGPFQMARAAPAPSKTPAVRRAHK
jgi:hypothetical protein